MNMRLQMADGRWQIGDWRAAVVVASLLVAGCTAGNAFKAGNDATKAGDLDEAVVEYRKAVQASPDNANYKIALERAQLAASRAHLDKAKEFESRDQLEAALGEYKQASEYDPTNRQATAKVAELDRKVRERIEASRPRPAIEGLRERARAASAPPMLNPASRDPIRVVFNNSSFRDILNAIGGMTGINITYDRDVQDRSTTVQLDGVTLEQALNQLMTMNQLSYKVVSDRSIFVFPDTNVKHAQYDEQVIRTFYLSNADATEVSQILSSVVRLPGIAVQPIMVANKTANTLTVRGTASMVQILEKIIQQNDKPRAEIVIDVEFIEVDRTRAKTYGLNLSEYALGGVFSPGGFSERGSGRRRYDSGVRRNDGGPRPGLRLGRAASNRRRPSTSTRFRAASARPISIWRCPPRSSGFWRATRVTKFSRSRSCAARRARSCRSSSATRFRSSQPATRQSPPAAPASTR